MARDSGVEGPKIVDGILLIVYYAPSDGVKCNYTSRSFNISHGAVMRMSL